MDDTRNRIIAATFRAVRRYGIDGVRISNIASLADLSPAALYRYFESKEELMDTCYFQVDSKVVELFEQLRFDPLMIQHNASEAILRLWRPYFRFWTGHPDEAVFYFLFRSNARFRCYDRALQQRHRRVFERLIQPFLDAFPRLKAANRELLHIQILNVTLMYAKSIAEGLIPADASMEGEIFGMILGGLSSYLQPIATAS